MREVIAEIGVNHNKSENIMAKMIEEASKAGASHVKFQRFLSSDEISESAELAVYQRHNVDQKSQLEMAKALELDDEVLKLGIEMCEKIGIKPMCSAFEMKSLTYLKEVLKLKDIKIPSPEITNTPFLKKCAKEFNKVYLSTGASYLWEIGYAMEKMYEENKGIEIILMHCVSEYPAPLQSLNLNALETIKRAFNKKVGFSDHSCGYEGSLAALALGADNIEKHVTLDKNMRGPDHKASSTFEELNIICKFANNIDAMMGNGIKEPQLVEMDNRRLIRKSIYINIEKAKKGDEITEDMLGCKRPYSGEYLSPDSYEIILGKKLKNNMNYDQGVKWGDIEL